MGAARRRMRGQSLVEFAITVPVLTLLVLGTVDLGRGFYIAVETNAAARQGVRDGIISDSSDIGDAVRSEPNSAIPNTLAVWGDTYLNQANGCTPGVSGSCGDPNGCPPSVFTGSRLACFAVRTCTMTGGATADLGKCTSHGPWGQRPGTNTGHALEVLVVYRLPPVTPLLGQLTSATGNALMIRNSSIANELYY